MVGEAEGGWTCRVEHAVFASKQEICIEKKNYNLLAVIFKHKYCETARKKVSLICSYKRIVFYFVHESDQ